MHKAPYSGKALKVYEQVKEKAGIDRAYIPNKLYPFENYFIYINQNGYLHFLIKNDRKETNAYLTQKGTIKY